MQRVVIAITVVSCIQNRFYLPIHVYVSLETRHSSHIVSWLFSSAHAVCTTNLNLPDVATPTIAYWAKKRISELAIV
jgi:hypothetical protein